MSKRIETYLQTVGHCPRELRRISRNEHGDILLVMDGGEIWQFTPQPRLRDCPTPALEKIQSVSQSSRGWLSTITLCNPGGAIWGDIRILPASEEPAPRKPPPNPKGRKPEYDRKEDARVFDLWAEADAAGCPSIERFREENDAIKKAYTLWELRKLIDREGKRRRKELAEMRKAQKSKKRQ